ncbi:hypothetical protein SY88_05640 [Clostridiales bacterium PH28_bin88]|nr:hypothetical protein SY88_05640 [Clostridiales bacterium PH28_bin88]
MVQAGIPADGFEKVVLDDPDDLEEVYQAMLQINEEVKRRFPGARKAISYTGGTKTMTAGAVLFAIRYPEWELSFIKGPREDLVKVTCGGTWWAVNVSGIYAQGQIEACQPLLEQYQYATVQELLRPLQMNPALPAQTKTSLQRLRQLCKAFDAWDRFDHQEALFLLNVLGGKSGPWIKLVKDILGYLPTSNAYQPVADMLLNAGRRVVQGHYDDAVARLYRSVEMLAQVRLKHVYSIDTGNLDLNKVPDDCREAYAALGYEKGRIRLPLARSYSLLADLNDDLGLFWVKQQNRMVNALEIRNYSIMAHGKNPIGNTQYQEYGVVLEKFIQEGLEECVAKVTWQQLPALELLDL